MKDWYEKDWHEDDYWDCEYKRNYEEGCEQAHRDNIGFDYKPESHLDIESTRGYQDGYQDRRFE